MIAAIELFASTMAHIKNLWHTWATREERDLSNKEFDELTNKVFVQLTVNGAEASKSLAQLGPALEKLYQAQTKFGNAMSANTNAVQAALHQGGIVPAGPPPTITGITGALQQTIPTVIGVETHDGVLTPVYDQAVVQGSAYTGFVSSGYVANTPLPPMPHGEEVIEAVWEPPPPPKPTVLVPVKTTRAIALDGIEEDE